MLTSGTLAGAQEFLASWIAKDRSKHGHYFTSRVPKMALYGAFISAPLGHVMISILQKLFAGRTSLKAKILQILVSNLIVWLPWRVTSYCFNNTDTITDLSYPERRLLDLDGRHCRRTHIPPDSRNRKSWIHARDEGLLDRFTHLTCIRPSVPA